MKKLLHERLIPDECGVCEVECVSRVITLSKYDARALRKEIERYYIPRPRFEDGEPVQFGDAVEDCDGKVEAMLLFGDGSGTVYGENDECLPEDDCGADIEEEGLRRPSPKAYDADGVEIKVGDTVWSEGKAKYIVEEIIDGDHIHLRRPYQDKAFVYMTARCLTHKEPDNLDKVIDDLRNVGTIYARRFADRLTALTERVD